MVHQYLLKQDDFSMDVDHLGILEDQSVLVIQAEKQRRDDDVSRREMPVPRIFDEVDSQQQQELVAGNKQGTSMLLLHCCPSCFCYSSLIPSAPGRPREEKAGENKRRRTREYQCCLAALLCRVYAINPDVSNRPAAQQPAGMKTL
jgi:hypothetical protein